MAVKFIFSHVKIPLTERRRLKSFIENLFVEKKKKLESLTYIFCTDRFLLEINKEFLRHDYFTDIITFTLSAAKKEIVGEVYISVDRVRENAEKFSIRLNSELHRVVFHGALHLLGFKDKIKKDKAVMIAAEDKCLTLYFK